MLGGAKWGPVVYIVLSLAGTVLLAVPSWHLVEKPAMSAKNWTPKLLRSRGPDADEPRPGGGGQAARRR